VSPLIVLVSMFVWGWLLGPIGALLSVPLTLIAKIVLWNTSDLHWVAVLLGPTPPATARSPNEPASRDSLLPGGSLLPRDSLARDSLRPPAKGSACVTTPTPRGNVSQAKA